MRKDPYAKERAELRQKTKGLSDPMQKFYTLLLENAKGEKGDTPVKGKDYWTPAERKELIADILEKIPVPKDADPVDYDLVLTYVTQEVENKVKSEVAKLPKPKDGTPGKDAVVDIPAIVSSLLKVMPKMESKEVDYLGIKDYIDKEVQKIKKMKPQVVKSFTGGGATSLSQLVDADLSGLTRNANGQYILGSGGSGGIQSIVAGTNVTVDNTDPANPIVSATGSGGGGINRTIIITSGNVTAGANADTDYVYKVVGAHTVTLPTAVSNTNQYDIVNLHTANISLATTSSQTIHGTTAPITLIPSQSLTLQSDGTNWIIK
jgi:hypothetical protein